MCIGLPPWASKALQGLARVDTPREAKQYPHSFRCKMAKNIADRLAKMCLDDKIFLHRVMNSMRANGTPFLEKEVFPFLCKRKAIRRVKRFIDTHYYFNDNQLWRILAILGARLTPYRLRQIRKWEKARDMIPWQSK